MKLLFDQNISFRILKKIAGKYSDAVQVKALGLQDSSDNDIWEYARSTGATIVTFDLDFQDLSNLKGHPPKIILLRTGNVRTDELAEILLNKYDRIFDFVESAEYGDLACLEIN